MRVRGACGLLVLTVCVPGCPSSSWPEADPTDGGPCCDAQDGQDARTEEPRKPEILNVEPGETLRHDLALLTGTADPRADVVRVDGGDQTLEWPVVEGRFKALVPLDVGTNELHIEAYDETVEIALSYEPQTNPRFVRLVYVLASDDDERFDAPEGIDNDVDAAVARIRLGARMLQTFTAEKMNARGFGRRTFRLLAGADGEPVVEVMRSALTTAEAYGLGEELGGRLAEEVVARYPGDDGVALAIMGMSHFDPATGELLASTSTAFGRVAMVGSGGLHTWASTVAEVDDHFQDDTRIDNTVLMDDSHGRQVHWANYSTTLGVSLVLLTYCWGLPWSEDPDGFTSRGFDLINRTFVMTEPASVTTEGLDRIEPADEVGLAEADAVWLRYHRWLALDARDYAVNAPPALAIDGAEVRVDSPAGLRSVVLVVDRTRRGHDDHLGDGPPTTARVTIADLAERYPDGATGMITAIDDDGNTGWIDFPL